MGAATSAAANGARSRFNSIILQLDNKEPLIKCARWHFLLAFVQAATSSTESACDDAFAVTSSPRVQRASDARFRVAVRPSSVASAFAHDGLAAKAAKQFDETGFTTVAVVEGRKNHFKFVFALI